MTHTIIRNNHWQWLLLITLLGMFTLPAQAAIPDNVDYQGYLTDSGGSPINGTVSVTFSLYNIDTGGISLWTDTQSVAVSNGLFNVKLGSAGNPFPIGLFDAPLWLGIDVASDGEMSPRTALSSTGFAHKADDADSVGGISAGNLVQSSDLSAHTSNSSAHHSKTTSFSELSDQASDAQIPANITRDSELTTHEGNASAHHSRYSNAEAVGAMGLLDNANPLNHDRRTGGQVFNAVLARDGAGTTLDADLVDGLEASEIIDAAQDEVRTPISSLPFTISTSGSYYVTANLDGSSGGINITADNITLDLMGFTLDGGGTVADHGIYITGRSNVTIKDGTVLGFGWAGIYQTSTAARYVTVMDVKALGNGTLGTAAIHSGIYLLSGINHIERCTAGDNGGYGIYAFTNSKLINNTAYNNTGSYAINGGSGSTIRSNTAYSNAHWGIYGASSSTIQDNTIYNNNTSNTTNQGGLRVGTNSRVIGNTLSGNLLNNIYVNFYDSAIENNLVTNSANGILFTVSGNFYANNRATSNTTNYNLGATTQTNGGGNYSF